MSCTVYNYITYNRKQILNNFVIHNISVLLYILIWYIFFTQNKTDIKIENSYFVIIIVEWISDNIHTQTLDII